MQNSLVKDCQTLLPGIEFKEAKSFYWSPKTKTIHIDISTLGAEHGQWALVHEVAHAKLQHSTYVSDASLLMLEVAAWQEALLLAKKMTILINPDHVQDCLNTYRDWLYARSTCPTCALNSLQVQSTTYLCLNCSTRWSVSRSRFCRPYRIKIVSET